jgi:hypothetical protein
MAEGDAAGAAELFCNDLACGDEVSDGYSSGEEDKERPDGAAAVRRIAWTRAS